MLFSTASCLWGALVLFNALIGSLALLPSAVILPLYIYPGDNCIAWAPLLSSLSTHRTLQFLIIINPNSGPGGVGTQPDSNYQTCTARLRTTGVANGNNVKMIGYVPTTFGARPAEAVNSDIDTYRGWNSAYSLEGIFFDEVSQEASELPSYQAWSARVKTAFGSNAFIVLNPGTFVNTNGYFNIANLIVTFEGFFQDFDQSDVHISSTSPARKQAVIIHDGPTQVPLTTVQLLTQTLGVGASFYTDFANAVAYSNFPTDWTNYLNTLVSTQ